MISYIYLGDFLKLVRFLWLDMILMGNIGEEEREIWEGGRDEMRFGYIRVEIPARLSCSHFGRN